MRLRVGVYIHYRFGPAPTSNPSRPPISNRENLLDMHQTLHIPGLLQNIFGRSSTLERDSNNADLAALARTCKAFKEPALDLLWEELDDLSPLLRCLPEACSLSTTVKTFFYSPKAVCSNFLRKKPDITATIPFNSVTTFSADH